MPTETSTVCVANSLPPYRESFSTIDDRDAPCPLGQADSERLLTDRRSCESLIDEGSGGQGLTHTLSPFGGISARRATEQQASHAGKTLACSSCRAPPSSWMMALINYNDYRVWSSTKDATRVSNSKEQPAPLHSTARLDCQTGVKYYGWQAVCTGSQSLGHFFFFKSSPRSFTPTISSPQWLIRVHAWDANADTAWVKYEEGDQNRSQEDVRAGKSSAYLPLLLLFGCVKGWRGG